MKRSIALLLVLFLICCGFTTVPALETSRAPDISAKSCILVDAKTGAVLYEKNADELMLIASTTKILTALVVLENCDPHETVEIKAEWTDIEGSSIYLEEGERLEVIDLLYGMMLHSGNDAAYALACYTAGSISGFSDMMNKKARELGCTESNFENPHGLDAEGQIATARELALITAAAMKNEIFAEIVSTKNIYAGGRSLENHNKLLWDYEGTVGVKTGYTKSAGRSLVSCAERFDARLICVTINDPDDWADHKSLYDWAFSSFEILSVTKGEQIDAVLPVISGVKASVKLMTGEDLTVLVPKKPEGEGYTFSVEVPKFVYAVVVKGGAAGQLVVRSDGKTVAAVPLIYAETVRQAETEKLTAWELIKRSWYKANEYGGYQGFGYY